ncbi:hypothetical protein DIPPA_08763 [Diplonema papillatum]|nr:hypothetical protein DIPPA_08763 [Diplonema papillatum]
MRVHTSWWGVTLDDAFFPNSIHSTPTVSRAQSVFNSGAAVLGCVLYAVLALVCVAMLRRHRSLPVSVRLPEFSILTACGGAVMFASQLVERQFFLQPDIPAVPVYCWLMAAARSGGYLLFVGSLICKQYSWSRLFVNNTRPMAPRWLGVVLFTHFISLMLLPCMNGWDMMTYGYCGADAFFWRVLSAYVALSAVPVLWFTRELSDPSTWHPCLSSCLCDVVAVLVVALTLLLMVWLHDTFDLSPSIFNNMHTVATLFAPLCCFGAALGKPLYRQDKEYLQRFNDRMKLSIPLRAPLIESGKLGTADSSQRSDSSGSNGSVEVCFEVEMLASEIDTGNVASVTACLRKTNITAINSRDRDGGTSVHRAVRNNFVDVLILLLDMGADANALSAEGLPPLSVAAGLGNVVMIRILYSSGKSHPRSEDFLRSALQEAIVNYQVDAVSCLLSLFTTSPFSPIRCGDPWDGHIVHCEQRGWQKDFKKSGLTLAIELGSTELVHMLLDAAPDDSMRWQPCVHGWTPLHLSLILQKEDVLRSLLLLPHDHINLFFTNHVDKRNAFHYAAMFHHPECMAMLVKSVLLPTGNAYHSDHVECTSLSQSYINSNGSYRQTDETDSLGPSLSSDQSTSITGKSLLCEKPIPLKEMLSKQDYLGRTPLHYAVLEGHADSVIMMLQHGAKRDIFDNPKATPLDKFDGAAWASPCLGQTPAQYAKKRGLTHVFEALSNRRCEMPLVAT